MDRPIGEPDTQTELHKNADCFIIDYFGGHSEVYEVARISKGVEGT